MNDQLIKRKILLELATHPVVITPMLFGTSGWILSWILDAPSIYSAVSVLSIVVSIGFFLTGLFLGRENMTQAVIQKINTEIAHNREASIITLYSRLKNEPDCQTLLNDANQLMAQIRRLSNDTSVVYADIFLDAKKLYDSCIDLLNKILSLSSAAVSIRSQPIRKQMLSQKKDLQQEIQRNVTLLGSILSDMQTSDHDTTEQLRTEVQQQIAVGKRVREQLIEIKQPGDKSCLELSGD